MLFNAIVTVILRPTILDPEGKAIEHALSSLGIGEFSRVRVGKRVELRVEAADEASAKAAVAEACAKLLANAVMEDYSFEITAAGN